MINRIASERPTYGYRRVWAVLRNQGIRVNSKAVEIVLWENNLSLPYASPIGSAQLWKTEFTYIHTEEGITYLMPIKDCFAKNWQGYNFSMSFLASDAIRAVEDAVMRAFDGEVPKGLILRKDNCPKYIAK